MHFAAFVPLWAMQFLKPVNCSELFRDIKESVSRTPSYQFNYPFLAFQKKPRRKRCSGFLVRTNKITTQDASSCDSYFIRYANVYIQWSIAHLPKTSRVLVSISRIHAFEASFIPACLGIYLLRIPSFRRVLVDTQGVACAAVPGHTVYVT